MKWAIRQEQPGDAPMIAEVVRRAFEGKPFADEGDAAIVDRLRADGRLVLSLVAVANGAMIGQVALSPARIGAGKYLCLGPIAVLPEHQGNGIGSDLMNHALGVARAYGRDGVVLLGDPGYYGRFGFKRYTAVTYDGPGADYVQVLPFEQDPAGPVSFHPALSG